MTNTIRAFMQFPTKMADGTVINNEDGGPAFLKSDTVGGVWANSGPLAGVQIDFKHTTSQLTRDIEVGEGERALVPLVTAWALTDMRDKVLVPGPIAGREGPAIIYKGLARFKGGKDMSFGGDIAAITLDPEDVAEIVNLTPLCSSARVWTTLLSNRPARCALRRCSPRSRPRPLTASPSMTCPTRARSSAYPTRFRAASTSSR